MFANFIKLLKTIRTEVAGLHFDYFSLTMATGIVSLASFYMEVPYVGSALYYLNIIAYIVLVVLQLLRLRYWFPLFAKEFRNPARSPGFLTIVAGTNILGYQAITFSQNYTMAVILFFIGLVLWGFLIYSLMTVMIVENSKLPLAKGINGLWLLMVVSTASICVLGTALAEHTFVPAPMMLFVFLALFLVAGAFYFVINTLVFYRLTFFRVRAAELGPAYWINMGAAAILTLAGADLLSDIHEWHLLEELKVFIMGFTIFVWAFSSWWIPLLIILGIWKNIYKRIPIRYKAQYWGLVFPIGMYTVCTHRLADEVGIRFLSIIPTCFVYIALAAWLITFYGLIKRLVHLGNRQLKRTVF